MSGQIKSFGILAILASFMLAAGTLPAAEKEKKPKEKKDKEKKPKSAPENPADLFKPTPEQEAKEGQTADYMKTLEQEVAQRSVPLPSEMNLDVAWYSPHFDAEENGKIIKGWVREELILLETDKKTLIAIRREDGVERWRCELKDAIRYGPAVSRNNVVVNINNNLVAIEKTTGEIRWSLTPRFQMSNEPLIIDPPAYPKEYVKQWQTLENLYVGGWDGRFYNLTVRGRMVDYVRAPIGKDGLSAPEFDIYYTWHKTLKSRGMITQPTKIRDSIMYYAADDNNVYATNREAEDRDPYYMLDKPSTGVTVTGSTAANVSNSTLSSLYIGARDNNVYCLDRLTLKKKWAFAAGVMPVGNIMADEPATPYVYVATEDGKLHALLVSPAKAPTKTTAETPESYSHAWEVSGAGAISASPSTVYVGLRHEKDHAAYNGVAAVDKASGRVLWSSEGGEKAFFTSYIEYQNSWTNAAQPMRLYAITSDNRIVALREKQRDTGVQVVKALEAEKPAPTKPEPKKPAGGDKPADK
jgi:outer membrane protein assembly factor BamB